MTSRRAALAALVLLLAGCKATRGVDAPPPVLSGAGATLPFPLYARWSSELSRELRVNYQPLGSGAGIRQIGDGVVDFGATDEPMTDEQLSRAPHPLVHVPMTIGGVAIAYNVPGVAELRLTGDLIADIFRGTIDRWDDPRLRAVEPALPAGPITVVHRADGSGTSATFTAFLSRTSSPWRADVGSGVSPRFPVGLGARGNDGVAAYVKATPLSIGYVELAHARQAGLAVARVRNRAGAWVAPTRASLEVAARSSLAHLPDDLRISIVDADGPDAYPIAALSFVVFPAEIAERAKAEALGRFLWWGLHEGQALASELEYAPLPPELVVRAERIVHALRGSP